LQAPLARRQAVREKPPAEEKSNEGPPFLWFDSQAYDAAKLYTSIFPHSEIRSVMKKPAGVPGPSDVLVVTFAIGPQEVVAMNGGRSC
jgi:predicted 3-demethylubiquinone-9 3-methyltransferase (glyoxalase superfamily)